MDSRHVGVLCVLLLALYCLTHLARGQGFVNIAQGKRHENDRYANNSDGYVLDGVYSSSSYFRIYAGSFFEVDLGGKYPVHNITIWIRSSSPYTNSYSIKVDHTYCVASRSIASSSSPREVPLKCSPPIYGQKVRIKNTGYDYLYLYEFQIFVCNDGYYTSGDTCLPCSVLCANAACDRYTGKCIECRDGYHKSGDTCVPCSDLCLNATCNRSNGSCNECRDGYHKSGDTCLPCSDLCLNAACNRSNGSCNGCISGRWGQRCENSCSRTCADSFCDRWTGRCNGCMRGYHGSTCNLTCAPDGCHQCHQSTGLCRACRPTYNLDISTHCTECVEGFYRLSPSLAECRPCPWRCGEDTACNKTTGHCPSCPPGWEGPTCLQAVKADGLEKLIAPLVSAVIVAALLIVVAIVVMLCWKHRSEKKAQVAEKRIAFVTAAARSNVYIEEPDAIPPPSDEANAYEICDGICDPESVYEIPCTPSNMASKKAEPV